MTAMEDVEVPLAMPRQRQATATPMPAPAPVPVKGPFHISPSSLTAQIHPLHEEVTAEVDNFFLEHWPFPNEKARRMYVAASFSRATCLCFPKALNDRIQFACRLLTLLFLVDGEPQ